MLGLGTTCTSYMVHVGIQGAEEHIHYAHRETLPVSFSEINRFIHTCTIHFQSESRAM